MNNRLLTIRTNFLSRHLKAIRMGFLSLENLNSLRKKGTLQELTKQTEWILGYWQTKTAALQSSMVFRFTSSFQNLPVFFHNPLLSLLSLLPYLALVLSEQTRGYNTFRPCMVFFFSSPWLCCTSLSLCIVPCLSLDAGFYGLYVIGTGD